VKHNIRLGDWGGPNLPRPPSTANGVRYRVENLIYNMPDVYLNPRNLHYFMVDFTSCTVRPMNKDADKGLMSVKVSVCRANRRLTFAVSLEGNPVEYDWGFRDDGKIVAGIWRQPSGSEPCVGEILGTNSGWQVR
jgi:hypothetical protein